MAEKKYTLNDVFKAVKARIGNRPICTNALSRMDRDEKFDIDKLNDLADKIVDDTLFYG